MIAIIKIECKKKNTKVSINIVARTRRAKHINAINLFWAWSV
jgi:hypothetical protein